MSEKAAKKATVERVVELAMKLGGKHLADYGSARSRHDFTQRQLMGCLILRAQLDDPQRRARLSAVPGARRGTSLRPSTSTRARSCRRARRQQLFLFEKGKESFGRNHGCTCRISVAQYLLRDCSTTKNANPAPSARTPKRVLRMRLASPPA